MMVHTPLEGLRVVELGTHVAVPSSARLLAEYGADVIKVESLIGDDWRRSGLNVGLCIDDFCNTVFTIQNNGKKLIALDLKTPEGKDILLKLLERADVFVTNVRMKSLQKLGLDYDTLQKVFPRLIYCHFTGYGHRGPDADRPGFDVAAFWSRVGARVDWVEEGTFPVRPSGGYGDMVTGLLIYGGILTALLGREKTGRGTMVTNSLFGTSIWVNAQSVVCAQEPASHAFPEDIDRPGSPVVHDYPCKDGEWLALVGIGYAKNFPRYARVLGIEDELADPRCENEKTLADSGHIADLTRRIRSIMLTKTSYEWEKLFTEADLVFSRLNHFKDVQHDRQAWDNGYLEEVTFANGVKNAIPRPPVHLSGYEQRHTVPLGRIGENTDDILHGLGYSQDRINDLRSRKCIQ